MDALSIVYLKRGNMEAKARKYREAFEDYSASFLSRLTGIDMTLEFVSFYRYQLLSYLKAKPVFTLSEAVDNSPFNVTGEGRKHLLESVSIVFPWQNDTEELPENT